MFKLLCAAASLAVGSASVESGSSSGHAIRLQGGDLAGFASRFDEQARSTLPTNVTGFTMAYWVKLQMPVSTSGRMFMYGDVGTYLF